MLNCTDLLIWLISDFVLLHSGIYVAFMIRFAGAVPAYTLNGYYAFFFPITFFYLAAFLGFGLYKHPRSISYSYIFTRSGKALVTATAVSLAAAGLMKHSSVRSFPVSVFIIGAGLQYCLITVSRVLTKKYTVDAGVFNRLGETLLWRSAEAAVCIISLYLAGRTAAEPAGTLVRTVGLPAVLVYTGMCGYMHVHSLPRPPWTGAVVLKTAGSAVLGTILFMGYLFIVRETGGRLIPGSVLAVYFCIYTVILTCWYLAVYRLPVEVSVNLAASHRRCDNTLVR